MAPKCMVKHSATMVQVQNTWYYHGARSKNRHVYMANNIVPPLEQVQTIRFYHGKCPRCYHGTRGICNINMVISL